MSTELNGLEKLKTMYESYLDFHGIYAELKDGTAREVDGFVLYDGYLFFGRKLCIPRTSLRKFLIWELHAGGLPGHFENEKTIEAVEYRFYMPSLNAMLLNMLVVVRFIN